MPKPLKGNAWRAQIASLCGARKLVCLDKMPYALQVMHSAVHRGRLLTQRWPRHFMDQRGIC